MKNKILIKVYFLEMDEEFDLFIPVNELIWKIKKLIVKGISDLIGEQLDMSKEYILMNKLTSQIYQNNNNIVDTDIRNATELVLFLDKIL